MSSIGRRLVSHTVENQRQRKCTQHWQLKRVKSDFHGIPTVAVRSRPGPIQTLCAYVRAVTTGSMLASIMDCLPDLSSFGSAAAKVSKPPKHHDRTQRRKIRGKKSDYKQPSANRTTTKTASSQAHRCDSARTRPSPRTQSITNSLALTRSPHSCMHNAPRPSSSDSLSGPSSRRSVTTDKQESREPKSKPKTKLKPKPTKTKLKPKPNANTSEPRAPEPVAAQSELRLYYTKKKKVLAILVRSL